MVRHKMSGIPVVEKSATGLPGKLVGILTNRDVRFAEQMSQPVAELMTSNNLATVKPGVSQEDARRLLHQRRIEKLLVVDEDYRSVGLITVKDRSEEHTTELQSLMRISYDVICLKKKNTITPDTR